MRSTTVEITARVAESLESKEQRAREATATGGVATAKPTGSAGGMASVDACTFTEVSYLPMAIWAQS